MHLSPRLIATLGGLVLAAAAPLTLGPSHAALAEWNPPPVDAVFPVPTELEVFLLSRIAFHEADGRSRADHAAIYEVLRHKAERRGVSLVRIMRRHSARATCTRNCTGRKYPRSARTAWIQQLSLNGRRPRHYQGTVPWSSVRARWLETVELSRRLLMGWERSECACTPMDWGCQRGSCNDSLSYVRYWRDERGLDPTRIDCGNTYNVFWRPDGGCAEAPVGTPSEAPGDSDSAVASR